ncbi:cellulose biosynthesis cyclic di-GMP-binding regulatory protein BcsB [Methylobacterium sp. WL69]|uniref:cellulose biosynthesis cyclic di-GMP-binding regulatory protein BcsB n=1 Tax=Methylobacterium sp. WL69 TaxID=2603893 RepID=UPI0011CC4365|nr:cellulose biosynthesis cyclic di-GMP-binding regulatory protein BcsB [Methylobacterium sp. WL69]TXM67586.1 cellulose biosynthesis cyclic di-GMP-binding regulatory protein BcsB [Methylobacterium sp. WL69]
MRTTSPSPTSPTPAVPGATGRPGVRRLAAAGLCAIGLAGAAQAQTFLGGRPSDRFGGPPSVETQRPVTAPSPVAPGEPTQGRVNEGGSSLASARRLPSGTRGMRLSGEFDSLQYPVFLTAGQARGPARMRVSYLSAISVAPESSDLSVTINGEKVGWTRIQAPGAVKVVEFAIPDGRLTPGYNAVRLSVSQRHRVDCSVGATYELWTQIDPSRTGLVVPPAGQDLDLRNLAALEPDESGALPVRVLLTEKPGLRRLQRMIGAVQAIALVGRLARPSVEFGAPLAGRAGVTLVVGTVEELRGVEGIAELGAVTGPKLALLPDRGERAPTLVVTGASDGDVAEAIQTLSRVRPAEDPGTEDLAKLNRGYEVQGGETLSLDAVGVASQEFNGRLLRTRFELRMPADFIPADYGKVMLHLAGASAAGLSPEARVIVDVNGRNAASVPLAYGKGELFEDSAIPLPLNLWRPGLNQIDISAQVPTEADRTCDTLSPGSTQARFLMLQKTRIVVPRLARGVRNPDLAAVKGGAIPFVSATGRPRLVLPTPDRDSAAAAAVIAARLAIAAKRVIDFEVTSDQQTGHGPTLVVAPARALDPATIATVGLDADRIRQGWEGRAESVAAPGPAGAEGILTLDRLRRNVPIRCALPSAVMPLRLAEGAEARARERRPVPASMPIPQTASAAGMPPAADEDTTGATSGDLVAKWDQRLRGGPSSLDSLANAGGAVSDRARQIWHAALDGIGMARDKPVETFDSRASLIVAQGAGAALDSSVVLVTAPNAWILKASASCLVDPRVWTNLLGRAAFLDAADGTFTIDQPDTVSVIETQSRSLSNLWLLAAAWLSLNPAVYVALMLLAALCLGLATAALVRDVGRSNR